MLEFPVFGSHFPVITRPLLHNFIITIRNMESLLKAFNPKNALFGLHDTFGLRYFWLTKGFQVIDSNNAIFSSDKSTIELGIEKNRVNASRYWL